MVYILRIMEGRLVIFLACVAVTLFVNTIIIFMVFKIFGDLASKVTEEVHDLQTGETTSELLTTLQSASENAVKVTGVVREQLVAFGPALDRIHAEHTERLAKADVRFKLVFRAIHFTAEKVDKAVSWPVRNLRMASAVLKGVFAFMRGSETDSDATPTPKR